MPIYDYRCADCGTTYDIFHKKYDIEEEVVCPSCASPRQIRLISAPMITTAKHSTGTPSPDIACERGGCCGGSCGVN